MTSYLDEESFHMGPVSPTQGRVLLTRLNLRSRELSVMKLLFLPSNLLDTWWRLGNLEFWTLWKNFDIDQKICAMPTTHIKKGATIFFGDVNFEVSTLNNLVALCLGYGHILPCARCHSQKKENQPLFRCTRYNMTHYCSVACHEKHWKNTNDSSRGR